MSQDVWFTEDLQNLLLSINAASAAVARLSDEALVAAYRLGFEEAVESLAVALGIAPNTVGLNAGRPVVRRPRGAAPSDGQLARQGDAHR